MATFMNLSIERGETIAADTVLQAMRVKASPGESKYAHALLGFADKMEKSLRKEGYSANCKVVKEGVRWLTDEEGLTHNIRRRKCGKRKVRNALRGLNNVNEGQLSATMRSEFERVHRVTTQEVIALRGVSAIDMAKPFAKKN